MKIIIVCIFVSIISSAYSNHGGAHIIPNYTPCGSEYRIGNLTVYESQNRYPKRVLIGIHDFNGITTNLQQIADVFSGTYNFRVVLPNIFRIGCPFSTTEKTSDDLREFVRRNGDWNRVVKWDILNIINIFKTRDGITQVGIYGMGSGGALAMLAASQIDEIDVAGLIHPATMSTSDANGVIAPMYLMPAGNDQDLTEFFEILKQKFGDNCGHKRFDDMLHGFAGSAANFSDPLVVKRVEEVIDILAEFFDRNLPNYG